MLVKVDERFSPPGQAGDLPGHPLEQFAVVLRFEVGGLRDDRPPLRWNIRLPCRDLAPRPNPRVLTYHDGEGPSA